MYISQSKVYFENKWNLNEIRSQEKERLFYEFELGNFWLEPANNEEISALYFRSNLKNRVYSRDPYKVMALLGDIGGFTEVLYLIGFALTTSVVRYQFSRDLMSSTY